MRVSYSWPLLLSTIVITTAGMYGQTPAPAPIVTSHEASFWRAAKVRVMPTYPPTSLKRGTEGVVVTSVTSTKEGRIERVDVLESPDADMAAAVRSALEQWTIPAAQLVDRPTPNLARAKMTFYFQIRNGKGVVLTPEQMPGNEDVFAAFNRPPVGRGASGAAPRTAPVVVQHGGTAREIDETQFTQLIANANTVVLDVRDRDQFSGDAHPRARNMPANEVGTRSRAELPLDAAVVIDCSRTETSRCRFAHDQLRDRGFKNVAIYLP